MNTTKLFAFLLAALILGGPAKYVRLHAQDAITPASGAAVRRLVVDGVKAEQKWDLNALTPALPADWTPYDYLVLEMRTSTPQRFSLWVHTANGPRRVMLQPFGQNAWLRASIPLSCLRGRD